MADYTCGNCANLEKNGRTYYGNEYYCKCDGKTHPLNGSKCRSFTPDTDTRRAEANSYHRAGWYITTAVIKILEERFGPQFEALQPLYKIREYMEGNIELAEALNEYDLMAPIIADTITNSEDKVAIAIELAKSYLLPSAKAVQKDDMTCATNIYFSMFNMLKIRYSVISAAIDKETQRQIDEFDEGRKRYIH